MEWGRKALEPIPRHATPPDVNFSAGRGAIIHGHAQVTATRGFQIRKSKASAVRLRLQRKHGSDYFEDLTLVHVLSAWLLWNHPRVRYPPLKEKSWACHM